MRKHIGEIIPCASLQDEELRQAKEEQERREEEEYQRLKEAFVIEEQGESEELTEQEVCVCPCALR